MNQSIVQVEGWLNDNSGYLRELRMLNIAATEDWINKIREGELAYDQLVTHILDNITMTSARHVTTADEQVNIGDQDATDEHADAIWKKLANDCGREYFNHVVSINLDNQAANENQEALDLD